MDQRDERTWTEAWEAAYPERATAAGGDAPPAATKQRRRGPRTRSVALATGMLVLGLAPFGVAATGDVLREGQRNGTATRETEIIADEAASSGAKGGYATRQSNKSNSGGGAIYGCRSRTGAGNDPCLRSNNLSTGSAFQFNTVGGESAGTITAGAGGDAKRPFTTNATGVATGLNADRVDGVDAASLRTRWALINEQGLIDSQSGGFTILDRYADQQQHLHRRRRAPRHQGHHRDDRAAEPARHQRQRLGRRQRVRRRDLGLALPDPRPGGVRPGQLQERQRVRGQPAQQRRHGHGRNAREPAQAVLRGDHRVGLGLPLPSGAPGGRAGAGGSGRPLGTSTRRLNSRDEHAVLVEDARVDADRAAVGLGARRP